MPYIDLVHGADCASIWYETSCTMETVNNFDPGKPTIAWLPPLFMSTVWMSSQMNDFRLKSAFNMIAFDHRSVGPSYNKYSPAYDTSVQAADLAYCFQYLCLSPVHLVAIETISVMCALRFVSLFPDMVLSLTLVNVPPPTEPKTNISMVDELMQLYCFAQDLDTLEHASKQMSDMLTGPDCEPDLVDDLIAYFQQTLPPIRRTRCLQIGNLAVRRTALTNKMLESITCPVLIIQSEDSPLFPQKCAHDLADKLVNCKHRPVIFIVKNTQGYVTIRNPSIINQTILKFLSRLPPARSDITPPQTAVQERMRQALALLGDFIGDKTLATREPLDRISSLNFSCMPPELRKTLAEMKAAYAVGALEAYNPLRPNGRPKRKFSESKTDHWFHGESNSLSYSDIQSVKIANSHKATLSDDSSKTADSDVVKDGRVRRMNGSHVTAIEKAAIKGSMAKIIVTAPSIPRKVV